MTLADMWRDEGMEEGIQKGMEKGKAEALSKMAIRLLMKKFYTVPEPVKESILKLDTIALELLIEDLFEFETIDDINKYIPS